MEALSASVGRGISVTTTNYYLSHLKSFFVWLIGDKGTGTNPVAHLDLGNTSVDRRHCRRELSTEEVRRLLEATRDSSRTLFGFSGEDRFVRYAMATGTGLRAAALASLTPASFAFEADPPGVHLAARKHKSRKPRRQPLPSSLDDLLRAYLVGRPTGVPLWGGDWPERGEGAEMLRADLEAAGIPYEVQGRDGPLFADFHSLRHTHLTGLGRAGVDLRTVQELAGHSTPALTAKYMHVRDKEMGEGVEKLPNFLPDSPSVSARRGDSGLSPVCRSA